MHFVDCDRPAHRAEILNPFELAKKVLSFMLHTVEPFYTLHHRYKLDVIQTTGRQKTAINECSLGAQGEPTSQVKVQVNELWPKVTLLPITRKHSDF